MKKPKPGIKTVIKLDGHFRIRGKCRKHEPQSNLSFTVKNSRLVKIDLVIVVYLSKEKPA